MPKLLCSPKFLPENKIPTLTFECNSAGQSINVFELGARCFFCFCNTVSLSHQDLWHMWKIFWMCFLLWEWPLFNDAVNFSPTVSVAHWPYWFFLCPVGVCFKVVWFAQIPIGCRWPQLGGADYNQVLSNCWTPHEQGWALTGSTGATGGQEPPGGGGTHISLRTFPQRVATY